MDRHTAFADENEMFSYLMSAKTGDQVCELLAGGRVGARARMTTRP